MWEATTCCGAPGETRRAGGAVGGGEVKAGHSLALEGVLSNTKKRPSPPPEGGLRGASQESGGSSTCVGPLEIVTTFKRWWCAVSFILIS